MPDGDSILDAAEYFHYKTNCAVLYENMKKLLENSEKKHNRYEIIRTYGIPFTNFDMCKKYDPIYELINKKKVGLEVKSINNSSYNLSYETEKNKYIVS